MKISIITVCFNSGKTIRDTILSIKNQTFKNIEYIIIDGASTDNTLSIVDEYKFDNIKVVSEPDAGLYDAMNKGVSIATGDVVGFLNSDDFYADSGAIEMIVKYFAEFGVDACYGDLCYVRSDNPSKIVRFWESSSYVPGLFSRGWVPPHPTLFIRRSLFSSYGLFNLDYKIAADFDLMFRFIEIHAIKTKYIPKVLVHMRLGGTTNKSFLNILKQNFEILSSMRSYGRSPRLFSFFGRKFFSRATQFLARP